MTGHGLGPEGHAPVGERQPIDTEAPDSHRKLFGRALRRTPGAVWDHDLMDWAAALTYYAMLAIFPMLLVTVSVVGLTGQNAVPELVDQLGAVVPEASRHLLEESLRGMADQRSAVWLLVVFGTIGSLWSATSYLGVFRRALHTMYGVRDTRPIWRTLPRIVLTALMLLVLLVSSALVLLLTGGLARFTGHLLGMDSAAITAWNVLKWPLLLCLGAVLVLMVFRTGPRPTRDTRRNAPGGALAVVLWLTASAGFALYASNAPTYNRLYGSLAGIVVFLVWLWVTNLALLAGAQFNVEVAIARRMSLIAPGIERVTEETTDPTPAPPGSTRTGRSDP
ncbi:YihY/virulence factor BrkB family protein [Streptomyces sp. ST2-7A]|uniref:YihY/virulence factor BrkB family protein n=1 Tax=Streptomyces sp. ST2-7A TaxID=2907214 RepID=UPI001F4239A2|nr:YihY/virulence factor BrkB family protein [Streptomyces sp. ST2-7A]MCE7082934.1 YihY/virulence factor BrkB family protein [Streptomyces sp. ST2-7A]